MTDYDVIVVGAGPAGSTAARALAQGGARVCLVDKARFPRPKPCGGALSPRTIRHLPHGFEKIVRTHVRRAVFTFRSGRPFEIVSATPMGYMVCREEFDVWLKAGAEEAGVSVREGVPVRAIEETGAGITVRAGGEALSAPTLIGADGANSLVAAQLLSRPPPPPVTWRWKPRFRRMDIPWGKRFLLTWGPTPADTPGHFPKGIASMSA